MSLLREIQNAAVDAKIDISTLLRKCKILAARLGSSEFKQWIENELNGYKNKDDLPSYRILSVNSKGHFSGPFQSGLRNADLPLFCVPEELREVLGHSYLMEPVASLQALIDKADKGVAQEPWNPSLVAYVSQNFYQNMVCVQAWKVIPISSVIGAVDSIRNKILSFVLEIEAEAPNAGEAPVNSKPIAPEKVHQIFNTYITGNVQNVATGSSDFAQTASGGDVANSELFDKLLKAAQSLPDTKLNIQVSTNIEKMRSTNGTQTFAQHYQNFMSILADHMQVLGPVLGPYLPALAAIMR